MVYSREENKEDTPPHYPPPPPPVPARAKTPIPIPPRARSWTPPPLSKMPPSHVKSLTVVPISYKKRPPSGLSGGITPQPKFLRLPSRIQDRRKSMFTNPRKWKVFGAMKDGAFKSMSFGQKFTFWFYNTIRYLSRRWFTHALLFLVLFGYTCLGGLLMSWIEGSAEETRKIEDTETHYKQLDARNKTLATLWNMTLWENMTMEEWREEAVTQLEDLGDVTPLPDEGSKDWSFWGAVFYCGTVITTIGYGHIAPKTILGQGVTLIYAFFGIPILLMCLADFGKLFTRTIKYMFLCYKKICATKQCRNVKNTKAGKAVSEGVQKVVDIAMKGDEGEEEDDDGAYEITDEFDLPISMALLLLVLYMLLGAFMYTLWEDWSFFTSFYFVFISMSTIGFGDVVPDHPKIMMASVLYLILGLALMTMCIDVVQSKISNTFNSAAAGLSEKMGLDEIPEGEEDNEEGLPKEPRTVEFPETHTTGKKT